MNTRLFVLTAAACAVVVPAVIVAAGNQDLTDGPAVQDAIVNFGHVQPQPVFPNVYLAHILDPDEVTIFRGGTVTFTMHGMGHGIAIYPVSKNTTRVHIAEDLCQGPAGPEQQDPAACNIPNMTAARPYTITDGSGQVVIDIAAFPGQLQVDSRPGQLLSAGGMPGVLLTGSTLTTLGSQLTYRFAEDGRYLVICINRVHSINDWMFGFVNVK